MEPTRPTVLCDPVAAARGSFGSVRQSHKSTSKRRENMMIPNRQSILALLVFLACPATTTAQGDVDVAAAVVTTRHFAQLILVTAINTARLPDRNVPALRSDISAELKLALAISTPDSRRLDLEIEALQSGLRMSAELFKDDEFVRSWLEKYSRQDADSDLQRSRDTVELLINKMVTPQVAAAVLLARSGLRGVLGQQLTKFEQSFRTQVKAHLSRSPELAKAFIGADAVSVSPAIVESRTQLKQVLAQAEGVGKR